MYSLRSDRHRYFDSSWGCEWEWRSQLRLRIAEAKPMNHNKHRPHPVTARRTMLQSRTSTWPQRVPQHGRHRLHPRCDRLHQCPHAAQHALPPRSPGRTRTSMLRHAVVAVTVAVAARKQRTAGHRQRSCVDDAGWQRDDNPQRKVKPRRPAYTVGAMPRPTCEEARCSRTRCWRASLAWCIWRQRQPHTVHGSAPM